MEAPVLNLFTCTAEKLWIEARGTRHERGAWLFFQAMAAASAHHTVTSARRDDGAQVGIARRAA